jgi:hypothetical protein
MFDWLESTPVASWVKESWGWPFALTLHAFGTATIVGFAVIMCMGSMGMFKALPPSSLRRLIPVVWVCLGLQVVSGFLLLTTKPARYLTDPLFQLKFALIMIAILATLHFKKTLNQGAAGWPMSATIFHRIIRFGVASPLVWIAVLIAGELTLGPIIEYPFPRPFYRLEAVALDMVVMGVVFALMHVLNKKT